MSYLLAGFAIAIPTILVVQAVRGRVRMRCCAAEPGQDLRLRGAVSEVRGTLS